MKKILLITVTMLFLTGCTVNYNLEIDGDNLNEVITGSVTKEEYEVKESDNGENLIYDLFNNDRDALFDEESPYLRILEDKGKTINYNFSYLYNYNFDRSTIINTCFEYHIIDETEDYYYIKLSGRFYCMYSDKININVTSNNAVLENNATKVDGNVYSWVIKNDKDVDILLNVSKKMKHSDNNKLKVMNTFQIIGLIVLVVLCIITIFLYKKKNRNEV